MSSYRNDDPRMPWNDPYSDDPSKPWNNPQYKYDPYAPWNQPYADDYDIREYEKLNQIRIKDY